MNQRRCSLRKLLAQATLLAIPLGTSLVSAETIVGLSTDNRITTFDSSTPGTLNPTLTVSGLDAGEQLVGIDYRPATGQLYGLGKSSRIYSIDLATANATAIGGSSFSTPLAGDAFGFDFNPTVDRIRVVSDSGQNLRIHPDTGAVAATDGSLNYSSLDPSSGQPPQIVGSAYTENRAGATTTTLYGIDSVMDTLVRQAPPNDGTLTTVGSLGINFTDLAGFDISGASGAAFASLVKAGESWSGLYSIDLPTGTASWIGDIGTRQLFSDITVVPEPSTLAFGLLAAGGLMFLRRRQS